VGGWGEEVAQIKMLYPYRQWRSVPWGGKEKWVFGVVWLGGKGKEEVEGAVFWVWNNKFSKHMQKQQQPFLLEWGTWFWKKSGRRTDV